MVKVKAALALLLAAILLACLPQQQAGRERGHFLEVGDEAILILDISLLADELVETPFLCTQESRGLVCKPLVQY